MMMQITRRCQIMDWDDDQIEIEAYMNMEWENMDPGDPEWVNLANLDPEDLGRVIHAVVIRIMSPKEVSND
jgi:hypothetical protein